MASSKGPIKAHINSTVHVEFPASRVKELRDEGSLNYQLECWLELCEECIPREWRRDWASVAFKYALAALMGECGIQWEARKSFLLYQGDSSLFQQSHAVPKQLRQIGRYGGRNGAVELRRWYTPECVPTSLQGEGNVALIDGELYFIHWPNHGPVEANPAGGFAQYDDWLGDQPF